MSGSDPLCHLRACIGLGKDGDESGRLDRADAGVLKICLPSFKQGYETQSSYFLSCSPKFSHYGVPRFGIWSRTYSPKRAVVQASNPLAPHLHPSSSHNPHLSHPLPSSIDTLPVLRPPAIRTRTISAPNDAAASTTMQLHGHQNLVARLRRRQCTKAPSLLLFTLRTRRPVRPRTSRATPVYMWLISAYDSH